MRCSASDKWPMEYELSLIHIFTQAAALIREDDEVVYGDAGYLGIHKRPEVACDEHLSSIDYRCV